ncbi:MAG: acyl-CoA synthetase, partial [Burkholderiales bacterium]
TIKDIEALEQIPLEERIASWNVNELIRSGCERDPDKIAIHYVEDGDPASACVNVSYRDLLRQARQASNLFYSLGVRDQDCVFYLLPTMPQLFVVTMAGMEVGITHGANWMLKADHWVELIKASNAKVVVALGPTPGYEIWENLQSVRDELKGVAIFSVKGPGGKVLADSDLDLARAKFSADALSFKRDVKPDDVGAYVHSGGTTGAPKLVRILHRGMAYKCWANAVIMAHGPDDVILADYPMFHVAGFFGRGILALAQGMTILIPHPMGARDKKFIANYWKFVEKFRVSLMSGVPTTLSVLAKNPPTTEDISSMRKYMCTGSTAMPAEVAREIEEATGVRVLATYGATEFTQNVSQAPKDGDPKFGSGGLRIPYTQIRSVILDAEGAKILRDCNTDEIGAVIIKGPSITPGYVDESFNKGMFVEGWINNGDLGRIDADGYLWLTGRAKDLIIRGGHNIDPTMIEETLRRHKSVLLVAAVSKPDAYAGELPVAYVQLVKGSNTTGEEIAAFVREHITERAAAPKEVFVIDEMPLTDVGKPSKVLLRYDAARRAFTAALSDLAGPACQIDVSVGADATHGTSASVRVKAPTEQRAALEAKIHDIMKAYTMHHAVKWV